MTREEAIVVLEESKRQNEVMRDSPSTFWTSQQMAGGVKNAERRIAALELALTALRPVSREQVEKVRGEWTTDGVCSRCGFDAMYYKGVPVQVRTNYCPACGSPMTDKAVDMVMERLEALHEVAE